jgi:hypothetical protein
MHIIAPGGHEMPNCFTLARKEDPKTPVRFIDIDEELCKMLDVPVDEHKYVMGWYDNIGFALACGRSLEWCREQYKAKADAAKGTDQYWNDCVRITDYLIEHYTSDGWYQRERM